ncbi:MAG: hypothetical protein ACHP7K_11290 [Actinomycetales bacterium]|jgi:hypothetical protein
MTTYSASASSSSSHPHDWGRALAAALADLSEQLGPESDDGGPAAILGAELRLLVTPADDGVELTVTAERAEGSASPDGGGTSR